VRIWIDLSNSPHPLLFGPISRRLELLGHQVLLTARDNAQTVELARERWDTVTVIGGASPPGRAAKAQTMRRRVATLRGWARLTEPDLALSHNSYGQVIAARSLGIPTVTAMDFEHQPANHVAFRLAQTVLLPEALAGLGLHRQGATPTKTRFYPGLKEEVYLGDFEPDENVLQSMAFGDEPGLSLVVARPAPDRAVYHSFQNPLFLECVKRVLRDPCVRVVVLPRHEGQRRELADLSLSRCFVPDHAIDSRSLMLQADLMIGAGGTMTREAALLGVPTASLFAGRRPAVDTWLEEHGFMRIIRDVSELPAPQGRSTDGLVKLRERGAMLVGHFCDFLNGDDGSRR
jgi:predicted glycosyltransferase